MSDYVERVAEVLREHLLAWTAIHGWAMCKPCNRTFQAPSPSAHMHEQAAHQAQMLADAGLIHGSGCLSLDRPYPVSEYHPVFEDDTP